MQSPGTTGKYNKHEMADFSSFLDYLEFAEILRKPISLDFESGGRGFESLRARQPSWIRSGRNRVGAADDALPKQAELIPRTVTRSSARGRLSA
jgi:hypothetical protein